ncbi:MAG: TlpA family protein disulfide reductase [Acidobacteriota bacterium]|nr:TlpA family protein disulfide reductase [Acidobacteriota bacterium]MDH3525239.1 TlpA family protein disulfide reductase [Acidobacteriota bacterium]
MRPLQAAGLVLLLALALAPPAAAAGPAPALEFEATALDGSPFSGRSLAGKAVLLDFWGTWCAPCVQAFPKLQRLHEDYGDRLSVVGLAYYSGEPEDIAATAAEHGLGYTILAGNEETLEMFDVFAFPSYVLISAAGEVVFSRAGQVSDLYEQVAAHLGR